MYKYVSLITNYWFTLLCMFSASSHVELYEPQCDMIESDIGVLSVEQQLEMCLYWSVEC